MYLIVDNTTGTLELSPTIVDNDKIDADDGIIFIVNLEDNTQYTKGNVWETIKSRV